MTVPPRKRKNLPVETTRHAFAYVFAGSGKFCNASVPLSVPTEPVGWWLETAPPAEVDVARRSCLTAAMMSLSRREKTESDS